MTAPSLVVVRAIECLRDVKRIKGESNNNDDDNDDDDDDDDGDDDGDDGEDDEVL